MEDDNRTMPVRVARLITLYFRRLLSEAQHDQLDEWICASVENQKIFEEFCELHPLGFRNLFDENYFLNKNLI